MAIAKERDSPVASIMMIVLDSIIPTAMLLVIISYVLTILSHADETM